jgi:HPr kinase/phosphorylase
MMNIGLFFTGYHEELKLSWVTGQSGGGRHISGQSFESADLVGHLNLIHPYRIHVLGRPEVEYYNRLDPQRRAYLTAELLAGSPPALVMADGLVPPSALFEACDRDQVPLLRTPLSAAQTIERMRILLSRVLAPKASLHGVFMDVLGLGVLLSGESGLGKSELALELITRGHGLIADDVVDFARIAPDAVEGRCPALLQNMLEVRGLGLLDIQAIFGETSLRRKMRLRLIVQLIRRSGFNDYERLPLEAIKEDVLGLPIRKVIIPVAAGRNLAVLVEAAVRNTVLQLRGIDTMQAFAERQQRAMQAEAQQTTSTGLGS